MLKKILRGVLAAFTSPEAVKLERSLASLVVVRILLAIGASAATVGLFKHLIGG